MPRLAFERGRFGEGAIAEHVFHIHHPNDDESGGNEGSCEKESEKPGEEP